VGALTRDRTRTGFVYAVAALTLAACGGQSGASSPASSLPARAESAPPSSTNNVRPALRHGRHDRVDMIDRRHGLVAEGAPPANQSNDPSWPTTTDATLGIRSSAESSSCLPCAAARRSARCSGSHVKVWRRAASMGQHVVAKVLESAAERAAGPTMGITELSFIAKGSTGGSSPILISDISEPVIHRPLSGARRPVRRLLGPGGSAGEFVDAESEVPVANPVAGEAYRDQTNSFQPVRHF
jgi:hypothetical protein